VNNVFLLDTCTLVNFAVVDRLDLIATTLGASARWVAAVEYEMRRSAEYLNSRSIESCRSWLGEAIDLDEPGDISAVETIRLALGGRRREPLRHLGEAQSIHAITTRPDLIEAVFVTDDGCAGDLARRNGITVWATKHLMRACYDADQIGCPQAFELMVDMRDTHKRGIRVPFDHTAVC
jgi:hypothetical protein